MAFVLDAKVRITQVDLGALEARLAKLTQNINIGTNVKGTQALEKNTTALKQNAQEAAKTRKAQRDLTEQLKRGQSTVGKTAKALDSGSKSVKKFADNVFLAGKRYLAFVTATAVPLAAIAALSAATKAVIEFDSALVKLDQILSPTQTRLAEFGDVILKLSVETGTAASEISKAATILAQAGLLTKDIDLEAILRPLAQAPLLATIDNIEIATEGVLAITQQFKSFGLSINDTELILSKMNEVTKQYPVEVNGLIEAARRGGSAFAQFGGNLDEFIGLVTAVSSVTRESFSSIGTAIKTLSARALRPDTITVLEDVGISTRNANGELFNMIGILKSVGLEFNNLDKADQILVSTALGGFRQIGKTVAAIGQGFDILEDATAKSRNAVKGLDEDVGKATASLAGQFNILKAEVNSLVQSLSGPVFAPAINALTQLARGFTVVGQALAPIIPVLTQFLGLLATAKIAGFLGRLSGLTAGLTGVLAALGGESIGQRVQRRAGGLPAPGGTGGAAIGVALQTPLAQVALITGLTVGINALTNAVTDENSVSAEIVRKLSTTIGALLALNVILGRQTLGQALGGISAGGPARTAALGAGAALAVGGFAVAAESANRLAETISNSFKAAGDRIAEIDVKTTPIEDGVDIFISEFKGGLDNASKTLDVGLGRAFTSLDGFTNALGQGFIRLRNAGKRIDEGNFTGALEELFTKPLIDEAAAQRFANDLVSRNLEFFSRVLGDAVNQAGGNFRQQLAETLAGARTPSGAVIKPQNAKAIADTIIKQLGGINKAIIDSKIKKNLDDLSKTANNTNKALAGVSISGTLTTELVAFGKAVSEALRLTQGGLDAASSLRNLSVTELPELPKISAEDLVRSLSAGKEISLDFSKLGKRLGIEVEDATAISESIKNLVGVLGQIDFTDIVAEAGGSADTAVNEIQKAILSKIKTLGDISPRVEEEFSKAFSAVGRAAVNAIQKGEIFDLKEAEKILADNLTLGPVVGNVLKQAADLINKEGEVAIRRIQLSGEQFKSQIEGLADLRDPTEFLRFAIEELGDSSINGTEGLKKFDIQIIKGQGNAQATAETIRNLSNEIRQLERTGGSSDEINRLSTELLNLKQSTSLSAAELRDANLRVLRFGQALGDINDPISIAGQALQQFETATRSLAKARLAAAQNPAEKILRDEALKATEVFQDAQRKLESVKFGIKEAAEAVSEIEPRQLSATSEETVAVFDDILTRLQTAQEQINIGVRQEIVNELDPFGIAVNTFGTQVEIMKQAADVFKAGVDAQLRVTGTGTSRDVTPQERGIRRDAVERTVLGGSTLEKAQQEFFTLRNKLLAEQVEANKTNAAGGRRLGAPQIFGTPQEITTPVSPEQFREITKKAAEAFTANIIKDIQTTQKLTPEQANQLVKDLQPAIATVITGGFNAANIGELLSNNIQGSPLLQNILQGELAAREGALLEASGVTTQVEVINIDALRQATTQQPVEQQTQEQTSLFEDIKTKLTELVDTAREAATIREEVDPTAAADPEAISDLKDATTANTTALGEVKDQESALGDSLASAKTAMNDLSEGVSLQLEAMQEINVKVDLSESVNEVRDQFALAATNAAKAVVRQALEALAAASPNTEDQNTLDDAMRGLA